MNRIAVIVIVLFAIVHDGIAQENPATLESSLKIIGESEGRAVYEAFLSIPKLAATPDEQQQAFDGISGCLGQVDRKCVVPDFRPRGSHVREKYFSYSQLASEAIKKLGEPGRRGLVTLVASDATPISEQAAIALCELEVLSINFKDKPQAKDYPPLDAEARKTMGVFLDRRGLELPIYTLTYFHAAGFPGGAERMHAIFKTTENPARKQEAAGYLCSYGYAPALDDFLKAFKEQPELRGQLNEGFQYYADSDRITQVLTTIMRDTKDEALQVECRTALELVALKAERRKQYGDKPLKAN